MVMAVSNNEKEIANTMLKSAVHIGSPRGCGNPRKSTRKIGIGSTKNEGTTNRGLELSATV
jgi:hypothetical protein